MVTPGSAGKIITTVPKITAAGQQGLTQVIHTHLQHIWQTMLIKLNVKVSTCKQTWSEVEFPPLITVTTPTQQEPICLQDGYGVRECVSEREKGLGSCVPVFRWC